MIPLRDEIPVRDVPITIGSLIAINVAVFFYGVSLSSGPQATSGAVSEFMATWGLIPREFLREIAQSGTTAQVVWLTPLTAMFLHGGLFHLVGNLLYLWVFGRAMEDIFGHGRFLVFYLVCGLAAAAIQVASDPDSYLAMVGASGAISGVMGAYVILYPRRRLRVVWPPIRIPAALFVLVWIVIQIMFGLHAPAAEEGGVAWWAHVGGFAAGVALARSLQARPRMPSRLRI